VPDRTGSVGPDGEPDAAEIRRLMSSRGAVVLDGESVSAVERLARALGETPTGWQTLVPKEAKVADPWSLSGQFGMGDFPWHIDGAVADHPPAVLVMRCVSADPNIEPTHLMRLTCSGRDEIVDALAPVVVEVKTRAGRVQYLPALRRGRTGISVRWDPRTCKAIPSKRTGDVTQMLECAEATDEISWVPGRTLLINNRTVLHRRPAITSRSRILSRLYVY
jgi:L-asparagine oxygenase